MKKFEGIMICTDLDGTLLRNDKSISEENVRAIEYFKSEGGRFTFITGRMHYFVQSVLEAISPNAPIACMNGGALYDYRLQQYIWKRTVPKSSLELAQYVCEHIKDMGYQITLFDKIYFCGENPELESFRMRTNVPNLVCDPDEINDQIAKLVFCHPDPETILLAMELLKAHPRADEFDFIRSEQTIGELLPKGVNKGSVLPRLAETVGVDMSRVIAVGDFENDISMIRAAALGVAVGNARPEVKAAADHVTVSNEKHAIAQIIADIESGVLAI